MNLKNIMLLKRKHTELFCLYKTIETVNPIPSSQKHISD